MIRRAVIVGCGIAGPVLALFLKRVGIESVVCERRAADAADEGAFLGVAPNGMNVLAELGLQRAVAAASAACDGLEFRNARNRVIAAIDRSNDAVCFGARLQMIRRTDLHHELTAAARAEDIPVHFGQTLAGIDTLDLSRVTAEFADGYRVDGDVLIGCDGIHSETRRLVLRDAPAPAYSGLVDFGGFANCPGVQLPVGINVMVFGRRAFFGAFKTSAGQVWWFHNSADRRSDLTAGDAMRRILELHRYDPPWIADVIRSTPEVLGPFPLNDILSMPRWHDGRVCLMGDAAHATTPSAGQGASLALEDAMVLAQCLRDNRGPENAFLAFERIRRGRVEEIVRQSRRNGTAKAVSGPIAEWVRDRMLPFFLWLGSRAQGHQYALSPAMGGARRVRTVGDDCQKICPPAPASDVMALKRPETRGATKGDANEPVSLSLPYLP